jgi:hypothetical protein
MVLWIPVFTGMTAFKNFPPLNVLGGEVKACPELDSG